jgi:hypothetical protein
MFDAFGYTLALYPGNFAVSYNYSSYLALDQPWSGTCFSGDPACNAYLAPPVMIPLLFTSPTGFIELAWTTPSQYLAPSNIGAIPESSTWAMMLIGFCCVGFMACRLRSCAEVPDRR